MTWIAEQPVIWVFPDGERRDGRIALAAPEPDPRPGVEGDTTWKCEAALDGLWHRPLVVFGDDSLQPLLLMLRLLGSDVGLSDRRESRDACATRTGLNATAPGPVSRPTWAPVAACPRGDFCAQISAQVDAEQYSGSRNHGPAAQSSTRNRDLGSQLVPGHRSFDRLPAGRHRRRSAWLNQSSSLWRGTSLLRSDTR